MISTLESTVKADPAWEAREALADAFGSPWHVFEIESGNLVHADSALPVCDQGWQLELMDAAARVAQPQVLAEEDAVVLFAVPLSQAWDFPGLALAPFVTRPVAENESLRGTARLLGLSEQQAREWIHRQAIWPVHALERVTHQLLRRAQEMRRSVRLEGEVDKISANLAASYEEVSLLHAISQNFRLSSSDQELGTLALEWLCDCVPVEGLALLYLPVAKAGDVTYKARTEPLLITSGVRKFENAESLLELMAAIGIDSHGRPLVINRIRSELASHLPESIDGLIATPMIEGQRVLGYLVAFNHVQGEELGTVEANLLASVASMLGVHCSNRDLYRQQDEFLASVVRALTSAIDAKDPYTCGHSDRVARIATRIAQELGCDTDFLATIYMAGLLHDIGKIGIDDAVLRKPGRLTEAEFEHIKQHPALGYKILADIKQFSSVLPAVLHHHEQWDGKGYPCQLAGENIPYMARIVAVADAHDAMTSDRPYRPGMPEEKVKAIFTEGSGVQWDADVIAAFFRAYDDIRAMLKDKNARLSLDVETWLI